MAEKLKIIPLGGLDEIGKNMTVYEQGGDIIVVDCGMGWAGTTENSTLCCTKRELCRRFSVKKAIQGCICGVGCLLVLLF